MSQVGRSVGHVTNIHQLIRPAEAEECAHRSRLKIALVEIRGTGGSALSLCFIHHHRGRRTPRGAIRSLFLQVSVLIHQSFVRDTFRHVVSVLLVSLVPWYDMELAPPVSITIVTMSRRTMFPALGLDWRAHDPGTLAAPALEWNQSVHMGSCRDLSHEFHNSRVGETSHATDEQ
jgi:hypothetical protein